jgi:hypothetical protein
MTININLDIRAWASSGSDGYTNTTTNDGKIYCYKWSGGTDGKGNVTEHLSSGAESITITSVADRRFEIIDSQMNEGNTQFTLTVTSTYQATITDIDNAVEDDYFKLQFKNTIPGHNNSTFWCDPRVKNDD